MPRGGKPLDHVERVFHAVNVHVKLRHIGSQIPGVRNTGTYFGDYIR
jgi:hypothetical protein